MNRIATFACVAGTQILLVFLVVAWWAPAPSHAAPIERPDRTVNTVRVTYVERFPSTPVLYVELNDGSTWGLRPCKFEDGRNCYWDARTRGNHIGRSFVVVRGDRIRTNLI